MTTQNVIIEAYTEEDAIRQAMTNFKKVVTISKLKTGFKPDKTKVINVKGEGTKKWLTKFYIYSFTSKSLLPDKTESYTGLKLVGSVDTTKADAITEAKRLALELGLPMTVRLVKVLEKGTNVVSEVLPNGGVLGKWKIEGIPRIEK